MWNPFRKKSKNGPTQPQSHQAIRAIGLMNWPILCSGKDAPAILSRSSANSINPPFLQQSRRCGGTSMGSSHSEIGATPKP